MGRGPQGRKRQVEREREQTGDGAFGTGLGGDSGKSRAGRVWCSAVWFLLGVARASCVWVPVSTELAKPQPRALRSSLPSHPEQPAYTKTRKLCLRTAGVRASQGTAVEAAGRGRTILYCTCLPRPTPCGRRSRNGCSLCRNSDFQRKKGSGPAVWVSPQGFRVHCKQAWILLRQMPSLWGKETVSSLEELILWQDLANNSSDILNEITLFSVVTQSRGISWIGDKKELKLQS